MEVNCLNSYSYRYITVGLAGISVTHGQIARSFGPIVSRPTPGTQGPTAALHWQRRSDR
jgi:hypothetical protein